MMSEKSNKHQANAEFAKVQRANDAKKATSDYETEAAAVRAKTERLKALRLARDAAAPKAKATAAGPKGKKKGQARPPIGLARWRGEGGPKLLSRHFTFTVIRNFSGADRTVKAIECTVPQFVTVILSS